MTDFPAILRALSHAGVEFIIVGGAAATAHGSARLTLDLDLVYRRTPENQRRLVEALASLSPYPRGVPMGLPFRWDERTVALGLNFTLATSLGALDLFGEIIGGGRYEDLLPFCERIRLGEMECLCLGIRMLIQVKRAAGRPKDFEAIAELEAILEEQEGGEETT